MYLGSRKYLHGLVRYTRDSYKLVLIYRGIANSKKRRYKKNSIVNRIIITLIRLMGVEKEINTPIINWNINMKCSKLAARVAFV